MHGKNDDTFQTLGRADPRDYGDRVMMERAERREMRVIRVVIMLMRLMMMLSLGLTPGFTIPGVLASLADDPPIPAQCRHLTQFPTILIYAH